MRRPFYRLLLLLLLLHGRFAAAAEITTADRKAGHSLQHVIVRFHTGELARAGLPARSMALRDQARLGVPAGARLEESGFARRRRTQLRQAADVIDAGDWLYCHRPATQSVDQLLAALQKNPLVDYAEFDHIGSGHAAPTDPNYGSQWHHNNTGGTNAVRPDIRSTNSWSITTGSTNIILAVLDSGIATGNLEFAGRLLPGYDYVNNDSNPSDDHGHGTAVAATAAANANNTNLGAGLDWQCRMLPLKVLNSGNSGLYSWWASGINHAVADGADVINLSAGGVSDDTTLSNAVMSAVNAGVIIVISAGNDGANVVQFPARMAASIAVGATATNDRRTTFSNYGPSIDLCAPGTNIVTAWYTGGISTWSGTSFSAPLVSAAACLLLSVRPGLNQESARALLCASADDQVGLPAEDVAGFDSHHGWGRLNAHAALQLALAHFDSATNGAPDPAFTWEAPGNAAQRRPFRVDVSAWPDGPWSTAAVPASVTYTSGVGRWADAGAGTSSGPRIFRLAVVPP